MAFQEGNAPLNEDNGSVQQHDGFLRQFQTSQVRLKDSVVIGIGIRAERLFPLRQRNFGRFLFLH
jgi:DNA mismatch repair protein MutH